MSGNMSVRRVDPSGSLFADVDLGQICTAILQAHGTSNVFVKGSDNQVQRTSAVRRFGHLQC
jgi:hypothetical protein